ncbi:Hypothetical predicted protein [Podarcis lilfordi]|uniref:Uncharacterized protein n=1 Tax=Podarcis lilfordi TaxID=74358 RepID=A0AA35K0U1_9SAUR|nr:Hypothetical predicted protein [Podarcis lilfordi]
MEEQGPRERLEWKGKKPPAGQVGTIRDLLPRADLCQIKQEPEEGQPQQHWEFQKQDFLKTMQPPCSEWETPQAPSPPHSGDGVLSFRGAADASRRPSGRAGGTDQTLLPDTEGLLGKEAATCSGFCTPQEAEPANLAETEPATLARMEGGRWTVDLVRLSPASLPTTSEHSLPGPLEKSAARILIAKYWKAQEIPTLEEWHTQLIDYMELAEMTGRIRDLGEEAVEEDWKKFKDYLQKHYKLYEC